MNGDLWAPWRMRSDGWTPFARAGGRTASKPTPERRAEGEQRRIEAIEEERRLRRERDYPND